MEARSIPAAIARPEARRRALAVPWPLATTVFAATSIIVGLIWDISWHISIGRDTFWTPAHMGIYVGGSTAGLANAYLILRTTFAGSAEERDRAVRFWGFRGPLGAFVSVWGAGAMLTSAPFDDWWHAAYGLDVEILSPPHTVLLVGILFVLGGAAITALTAQNRAEAARDPRAGSYRAIFAYAMALLTTMFALAVWSDTRWHIGRSAHFYLYAAVPFPLVLAASARALRLRWPATTVALAYMALFVGMTWLLAPWPATPKLGPIHQDLTRMSTLGFPLLLAAPALAVDLLVRRLGRLPPSLVALLVGAAFMVAMLAVHWPFSAFMLSPASHNWFFAGDHYPYNLPKDSHWYRGEFLALDATAAELGRGLLVATGAAALSAWLGLRWGSWMQRVRR